VTVPGPPVELRVLDDVPLLRLELWVVGSAPDQASLQVHFDAPGTDDDRVRHSFVHLEDEEALPDGRPARRALVGPYGAANFVGITLTADGALPVTLGREDFTVTGDVWRAEVELVPGCAFQLQLTDEAREPAVGVVLALDGVPLAASDEYGTVQARFPAKPERLTVVTPGWALVEHHSWNDWGTVFDTGEFTIEDGYLDVFLRRAP
jgi:hypothetical protein